MWFHQRQVALVRVMVLVTPFPEDLIRFIVDYCIDLERYEDACVVSRQLKNWIYVIPSVFEKVDLVKQAYRKKAISIRDGLIEEAYMSVEEEEKENKLTEKLCKCIRACRKMYETRRHYYYKNKPLEDYFMNDNIRNNMIKKLQTDRYIYDALEDICEEILVRYKDF